MLYRFSFRLRRQIGLLAGNTKAELGSTFEPSGVNDAAVAWGNTNRIKFALAFSLLDWTSSTFWF